MLLSGSFVYIHCIPIILLLLLYLVHRIFITVDNLSYVPRTLHILSVYLLELLSTFYGDSVTTIVKIVTVDIPFCPVDTYSFCKKVLKGGDLFVAAVATVNREEPFVTTAQVFIHIAGLPRSLPNADQYQSKSRHKLTIN